MGKLFLGLCLGSLLGLFVTAYTFETSEDLLNLKFFLRKSNLEYSETISVFHNLTSEQCGDVFDPEWKHPLYEEGKKFISISFRHNSPNPFSNNIRFSFDEDGKFVTVGTYPQIIVPPLTDETFPQNGGNKHPVPEDIK